MPDPYTPAGRYRFRVEIWQVTQPDSVDSYGEETRSPTKIATRWANIEPLSSEEVFIARANDSEVTHRITLRYDPDLSLTARAEVRTVVGSRVFELGPKIDVDEGRREWRIEAIERTS